ncbi:phosphonate ABC transporter permease [Salipiger aestuarii]|uniref:Phosphonate transport system permease protein n=1 Tax=Salipiger aestuarii TaxID=568098 RepID=A0A327YP00_9RHOB|nr:phosphonate ABC transporter, permease protein PhnE [Salipiger aestuarii]EIE49249.1 phosphonate ABC transporter, permease protein [Citreicella sp. 357]KAA8609768.1 phosphonate ABC transporter permease [Salipiger aestuarii]KAB2543606.1 phosphonate ABC transporter permease [Salipiger aestuarii]RAK22834.1 phosphonate transport system permease protein [Salipiger aestuarii]
MTDAALYAEADRLFARKKLLAFGLPAVVLIYLAYIFFAFDIPGLAERARLDNARTLLSDIWSYKTRVAQDNRTGTVEVAIEGERKGEYAPGTEPDWVRIAGTGTRIDLGDGHIVSFAPTGGFTYAMPGRDPIVARLDGRSVVSNVTDAPDWISASRTRFQVETSHGRVSLTRNRTELFRYFPGWELFFFTLDSPYHGASVSQLFGDRIDPARANLSGAWHDFWNNAMWRHSDVAWALFETVLMAFLGTFGAAFIALPLAFLAAKNFTPLGALRFGARRCFDFLRGIDGLIWTIVLSRAFGPGPMTGALAILLTDTGSFGKLFSEALENVDGKQIEGLTSTGARPVQRYRFGVIPQIIPVLVSQVLYYLESNTRSATIIGAITGGGIGLLLTQAMITQKDWEEVSYYIILIVLMVMAMDSLSGWLRRKLIRGV